MGQQPGGSAPRRRRGGLSLKEGDDIDIHAHDDATFSVERKPGREGFLKRLRAFRGRLPEDFKFDRDKANAR